MANPKSDAAFPEANLHGELFPSKPRSFPVDPLSSDVDAAKELEKLEKAKAEGRREAMEAVRSRLFVAGLVVAAVAAGIMVSRKLQQQP